MTFGSVFTAMITPFQADGSVNYDKAQELANYFLDHGSDGILVAGTTGEAPTLSEEETDSLFRAVKQAVGSRGTVIGGVSGNNTAEVVRKMKRFNPIGLDAYLSATPYYNKPSQEGIFRHFEALDQASESRIVVYNIPGRCGVNIQTDTMLRLAELPRVCAVKESTGNVDQITDMIMRLPKDFAVYSGDDYMTMPMVAMGGSGVISVASHIVGPEIKEMVSAVQNHDLDRARELHLHLYPLFRGLFITANPIPVKTSLRMMGFDVGGFRLPLCEADAKEVEFLRELLRKYGKIE